MSSFAAPKPVSKTYQRPPSPPKRVVSPDSSPKKRPFMATLKQRDSFGIPPPLPPVPIIPEQKQSRMHTTNEQATNKSISLPDYIAPSHLHLLQRQSIRWLNMTVTIWSLVVLDARRTVDLKAISEFLEVIRWRAHGEVNEEEFSALYSEWMSVNERLQSFSIPRKNAVGVFPVRQILLEKNLKETDLDLFIGIIIHEANTRMLNSSVSFVPKRLHGSHVKLEVCTTEWLGLCEELFFLFDTPGYGLMRFDEAFFFCTAVAIGSQSWTTEDELDSDLSLSNLVALTLQFLADAGSNVMFSSDHVNVLQKASAIKPKPLLENSVNPRKGSKEVIEPESKIKLPPPPFAGKNEVTLSMFKSYLLKKNAGISALELIISHVKDCIENVARMSKSSGATELYDASQPFENLGSIGSSRLWQQAVLSVSDFPRLGEKKSGNDVREPTEQIPSILLFLLSDAEKYITGVFRASECPVESLGLEEYMSEPPTLSFEKRKPDDPVKVNEELLEICFRMWSSFHGWGQEQSFSLSHGGEAGEEGSNGGNNGRIGGLLSKNELNELQRDPAFQLICACLVQYKVLQQLLCAALYDIAHTFLDVDPLGGGARRTHLASVCANLLVDEVPMLVNLGFKEGSEGGNMSDWRNLSELVGESESNTICDRKSQIPDKTRRQSKKAPTEKTLGNELNATDLSSSSKNNSLLVDSTIEVKITQRSHSPPIQRRHSTNSVNSAWKPHLADRPTSSSLGKVSALPAAVRRKSQLQEIEGSAVGITPFANEKTENNPNMSSGSSGILKGGRDKAHSITPATLGHSLFPNVEEPSEPKLNHSTNFEAVNSFSKSKNEKVVNSRPMNLNLNPPNLEENRSLSSAFGSESPQSSKASRRSSASSRTSTRRGSAPVGRRGQIRGDWSASGERELRQADWAPLISPLPPPSQVPASVIVKKSDSNFSTPAGVGINPRGGLAGGEKRGSPPLSPVSEKEARLLAKLVSTQDRREQDEIVEQLKRLRVESGNAPVIEEIPKQYVQGKESYRKEKDRVNQPFQENLLSANISPLTNVGTAQENEPETQNSFISSNPASSIEDLLQQGQSAGKYAQMLREILRKMSRDDSKVHLQSLEQVLALGQNIALMESDKVEKKKKKKSISPSKNKNNSNKGMNLNHSFQNQDEAPTDKPDISSKNHSNTRIRAMTPNLPRARASAFPTDLIENQKPRSASTNRGNFNPKRQGNSDFNYQTPNNNNNNNSSGYDKSSKNVISRVSTGRAPGLMPDTANKKPKKVFGHPAVK